MRCCLETVGRGYLRVTLRLEKAEGLLEAVFGAIEDLSGLKEAIWAYGD